MSHKEILKFGEICVVEKRNFLISKKKKKNIYI